MTTENNIEDVLKRASELQQSLHQELDAPSNNQAETQSDLSDLSDLLAELEIDLEDLNEEQLEANDDSFIYDEPLQAKEIDEELALEQESEGLPEIEAEKEPEQEGQLEEKKLPYRKNTFEIMKPSLFRLKNEEFEAQRKEYTARKNAEKTEIQRKAFEQVEIELTQEMTGDDLKNLISAACSKLFNLQKNYKRYINKKIGIALSTRIPPSLRKAYRNHPNSCKKAPGFFYHSEHPKLKDKIFFIEPDMAYFFEQGTEMEELKLVEKKYVYALDEKIISYFYAQRTLAQRELSMASTIKSKRLKTFFDVLKYNPFWFDAVYKQKTGKSLLDK